MTIGTEQYNKSDLCPEYWSRSYTQLFYIYVTFQGKYWDLNYREIPGKIFNPGIYWEFTGISLWELAGNLPVNSQ